MPRVHSLHLLLADGDELLLGQALVPTLPVVQPAVLFAQQVLDARRQRPTQVQRLYLLLPRREALGAHAPATLLESAQEVVAHVGAPLSCFGHVLAIFDFCLGRLLEALVLSVRDRWSVVQIVPVEHLAHCLMLESLLILLHYTHHKLLRELGRIFNRFGRATLE